MKQFDLLMAYDAYQLSNWIEDAMFDSDLTREEESKLRDVVSSAWFKIIEMSLNEFAHYVCELAKGNGIVSNKHVGSLFSCLSSIDETKVVRYLEDEALQEDVDELVTSKLLALINDNDCSVTVELAKVAMMSKEDFTKRLLIAASGKEE